MIETRIPASVRAHGRGQRARIIALIQCERRNLPRHVKGDALRERVSSLLRKYRYWETRNKDMAFVPTPGEYSFEGIVQDARRAGR